MEEGRGFGEVKGQAETQHVDSCSVKRITDEDFLSRFSSEISLTVSLSSQFFQLMPHFTIPFPIIGKPQLYSYRSNLISLIVIIPK